MKWFEAIINSKCHAVNYRGENDPKCEPKILSLTLQLYKVLEINTVKRTIEFKSNWIILPEYGKIWKKKQRPKKSLV